MTTNNEDRTEKREYFREWRKKNPEKIAKIQERYWTRKAAEIRNQEQTVAADPGQGTGNNA